MMGKLIRRILTGPKNNLFQMSINYLTHIFQTIFYASVVGLYLYYKCSSIFIIVEAGLTFVVILMSVTCSFTDPGILTIKSSVRPSDEEIAIPDGIRYGHDYYR